MRNNLCTSNWPCICRTYTCNQTVQFNAAVTNGNLLKRKLQCTWVKVVLCLRRAGVGQVDEEEWDGLCTDIPPVSPSVFNFLNAPSAYLILVFFITWFLHCVGSYCVHNSNHALNIFFYLNIFSVSGEMLWAMNTGNSSITEPDPISSSAEVYSINNVTTNLNPQKKTLFCYDYKKVKLKDHKVHI